MPRRRRLARKLPPRLKPPIRTPHPSDAIDDYISGHADQLPRKSDHTPTNSAIPPST